MSEIRVPGTLNDQLGVKLLRELNTGRVVVSFNIYAPGSSVNGIDVPVMELLPLVAALENAIVDHGDRTGL